MGKIGWYESSGIVVAERNRMIESCSLARNESAVDCNGRDVARNECDVDESRRDANGTGSDARCSVRDVDGKQRIVDPSGGGVTSDVAHSIFQLTTFARKNFAQHYQPGRKLDYTPATLLEKPDSNKLNEVEIVADDKIQLLHSLHMQ